MKCLKEILKRCEEELAKYPVLPHLPECSDKQSHADLPLLVKALQKTIETLRICERSATIFPEKIFVKFTLAEIEKMLEEK